MNNPPSDAVLLSTAHKSLHTLMPLLTELGTIFRNAGQEIALVGGPVRDALLGLPPSDLDFTTSASPAKIEKLLANWADAIWDVGRQYGTIAMKRGPHTIEITTFRADIYDRASRKPQVNFGTSLEEDLIRRDFTVNSMALRLPELVFVDPHDGLQDLHQKILRTPGPPENSFGDDPLRMMRAARFASQLEFAISSDTAAAITAMATSLKIISPERIRDELSKLLLTAKPRLGLKVLVETGLAEEMLPELPAMRLERDEHHRHKDVYEHSLTVLEQAIALEGNREVPQVKDPLVIEQRDLIVRLAALLHDIGKPATRAYGPGGKVTFHHHEIVGARMARKRLKALRFDKSTTRSVTRLIELHLRFHGYGDGEWTDAAVRRYVADAGEELARLHVLTRSDCTTRNQRRANRLRRIYDSLETRIETLQEREEMQAIRPDLNGNQIAEILGISPGPVLGEAYKYLLAFRIENGPQDYAKARAALLEWWESRTEE